MRVSNQYGACFCTTICGSACLIRNGNAHFNIGFFLFLRRDLGLHLFKEAVAATPDIQRRVLHGLLSSIEKDRSGETVDKPLLRNLSRMYIALGMYHESFETPFIESSDNFYTKEFGALIQTLDVRSLQLFSGGFFFCFATHSLLDSSVRSDVARYCTGTSIHGASREENSRGG
jgi:hypothetical protein